MQRTNMKQSIMFFFLLFTIAFALQQPLLSSEGKRVAIIGAGAGGSSAAYHLQRFTSGGYNITLFEQNQYIGGRSTTIGHYSGKKIPNNDDIGNVELGASIFVGANRILVDAAKEFNLTLIDISKSRNERLNKTLGIWNGTDFIFRSSGGDSYWWGLGKLIWRYGLSAWKTNRLVNKSITTFVNWFYDLEFPFYDITKVVVKSCLDSLTGVSGFEYLLSNGVGEEFTLEIIEAATRVNYRSDVQDIHALEALVSLATDSKTYRIEGGNYQIFEHFIRSSGANLLLNTTVYSVIPSQSNTRQWNVTYSGNPQKSWEIFDEVIVASPFHQTGITLPSYVHVPKVPYRTLHVTYITTSLDHPMNHPAFPQPVPETILTVSPSLQSPPFFSASIVHYSNTSNEITYKVFSSDKVDSTFMKNYLFTDLTHVRISFQKEWKSYPHLSPLKSFQSLKLSPGLWYLNGMEQFISTMETSALAGASVAGCISLGRNTTEIRL